MQLRARSKHITNAVVYKLAELDSPMKQAYWNAYHCNKVIEQNGEQIKAKYCNCRWCLTCNRIRTAKLINGYGDQLAELKNPAFVTLTAPNVPAEQLEAELKRYNDAFTRIRKNIEKSYQMKIKGVRKLEITYNKHRETYHPHYHLIIEGMGTGSKIVELWLKQFPEANRAAQDVRAADPESLVELFKYVTKLTASTKKELLALDWIYQKLKGKRITQAYGITYVNEDIDAQTQTNCDWLEPQQCAYSWDSSQADWTRPDGMKLTGYQMDEKTRVIVERILRGNIDISAPGDLIEDVENLKTGNWQRVTSSKHPEEIALFQKMLESQKPPPIAPPKEKPKYVQTTLEL